MRRCSREHATLIMLPLTLAITFTLGVSAFCSLLEAFILSTTVAEIEEFKRKHRAMGRMLERYKTQIDHTSSSILTLNTIANTAGATAVGALAAQYYPAWVSFISAFMVFGILMFSEIVPKNLGVAYRRQLRLYLVYPLQFVRVTMYPIAFIAKRFVSLFLPRDKDTSEEEEQEILLLAEKSAKEGKLTVSERDLIANALSLDDVKIHELMTPRTVMQMLDAAMTVADVVDKFHNIPFARLPVFAENPDNVVGIARRREILETQAEGFPDRLISDLMKDPIFVPENANAMQTLQLFLAKHQQMAVVVDEYGSVAGVVTMEDIIEHLIGREIYEDSDMAVDMREFARRHAKRKAVIQAHQEAEADEQQKKRATPPPARETVPPDSEESDGAARDGNKG